MENSSKPEIIKPVEFDTMKQMWNKAFGKDLEIVKHPNTQKRTFFNGVNSDDEHGRQYNLTVIPVEMTEEQFLKKYQKFDTILISCMDKDASGPGYNHLTEELKKKTMLISMAGGIIQFSDKRQTALKTLLKYLAKHNRDNHIKNVYTTDHNHTCGYIKVCGLNEVSLAKKLNVEEKSDGENTPTMQMIKFYSQIIKLNEKFPQARLYLADIDRQGGIIFIPIPDDIEAKSLEKIIN